MVELLNFIISNILDLISNTQIDTNSTELCSAMVASRIDTNDLRGTR